MMAPIELFAWIVVIVVLVKIVIILKNPEKWVDIIESVWKNPSSVLVVSLILAGMVLYHLLQEITIVQIFAVILFFILLSAASMAIYSKEILQFGRKILRERNIVRRSWLPILIWVLLSVWVLKNLL